MGLTRIRAQQITDIDYKQAVRVITVTNVSLSGGAPALVDGVSLASGNRVLVTGQNTASQNGIYQVSTVGAGSTGTWIRSNDANQTGEIEAGMIVMVTEGDVYGDTQWKLITNDPIAVGETPLTFVKNGAFEFGNIYANGTPVVASTVGDTVTFTAGTNVTITANTESKTVTFAAAGGNPGGNTGQIQFNNAGVFSGSANLIFDGANVRIGGDVVPAANLSHDLGNATNYWRSLYVGGNTIYLGGLQLQDTGTNTLAIFSADGQTPANITATSSNAVFATSAGVVVTNAQPNITSVGTLTALSVTGNIAGGNLTTAGAVTGNGRALTSLNATNIDTGTLAQARLSNAAVTLGSTALTLGSTVTTVAGLSSVTSTTFVGELTGAATTAATVTTAAQPNITSVGTLTSLAVTGNVTSGNVSGTTGAFTTVKGGNISVVSDTISSTNNTITIDPAAEGVTGLVVIAGNLQVNGTTTTIDSTVVTVNDLAINVANNAATASAANDGGLRVGPVGSEYATWLYNQSGGVWSTALGIAATGNVTGGNVSGTTGAFTNVSGNGRALTSLSASNLDTGTLDQARLANAAVTLGSTALTLGSTVTTVAGLSSVTSTTFVGELTGAATTAGTVTTAAQANITSVGTLTSLSVTGNVTSGNVSGTTGAFTTVTGNGRALTSLNASNVDTGTLSADRLSGTYTITVSGAATTAGTVTTAAQPNITSVGTLTSLAVTGNVDSGNVTATGNITASFFKGDGSLLTGISSGGVTWTTSSSAPVSPNPGDFWYDTDDDKKYQYTNDGTGNAWVDQSAPTSFGNLTVGNILNGGANGTGNVGSSTGYFNTFFATNGTFTNVTGNGRALTSLDASNIDTGTLPSGRLSGTYTITVSGAATTAGTVTTAAQPNITSVGTLTSVTSSGSITASAATGLVNLGLDSGGAISLGLTSGSSSSPYIDFNTSATAVDFNVRLQASGNTGTAGTGTLAITAASVTTSGTLVATGNVTGDNLITAGLVSLSSITKTGANGVGNIGAVDSTFNTIFAKATSAQYADLAENYQADAGYEPGTVVVFGGSAEVTISNISHDTRVAGVVSTNPSYLMNSGLTGNTVAAVALTGRVPCWVQGPVSKGDRIVNVRGGIGGRMKSAEYEPGCIVGKSLEDIVDNSVQLIEVVIGRF